MTALSADAASVMPVASVLRPMKSGVHAVNSDKKDNNREPYDREKLTAGIVRSCHKRPVSLTRINAMVDEIETQIYNMGEKEIPAKVIGEIVMEKLKDLDEVAYVRFASVYREFKDVNTFMAEIQKILK